MSRAFVWKQDPTVSEIGIRLTYFAPGIRDGPSDDVVEIKGLNVRVRGDTNRDFLYNPHKSPVAFDAVHTFVTVRQVVNMYQRSLQRIGKPPFAWQWGGGLGGAGAAAQPINVYPHAGQRKNAYYSREERALKFFYFEDPQNKNEFVYTTRSYDVVAHETGHAVLDALRPEFWSSWHPETSSLHESFADITVILTMLSQLDQCEAIIAHSKANLHKKTFFNAVAEQFGEALYGTRQGLRNADNNLTMSQVSEEVHDISQVFTGAFYDVLADIFDDSRDPDLHDDAAVLLQVGEHMTDLILKTILSGPTKDATYADLASKMVSCESNAKWKKFVKKQFELRQILGKYKLPAIKNPTDIRFQKCHCTMATEEHMKAVQEAIRQKEKTTRKAGSSGPRASVY